MRNKSKRIHSLTTRSEDDGHGAFQRAADATLDTLQEELEVRCTGFVHVETQRARKSWSGLQGCSETKLTQAGIMLTGSAG